MRHDDYVAALRSDSAALAAAGRATEVDAPVPSCPEWTVHALLEHVGGHHRWVRGNLDRTPEDGMQPFNAYESAPEDATAAEWVEEGAADLADRLAEVGPDQRCWTWVPDLDATTRFWARRTANETAVHRWDMQNVAGAPEPIDGGHAVDALDEYLSILRVIAGDRLR